MNFLRKFISLLVLVVAVTILVGICINPATKEVWSAFGEAFKPFSFQKLITAVMLFLSPYGGMAGTPIILIMLGFIGFCIPKVKKQK